MSNLIINEGECKVDNNVDSDNDMTLDGRNGIGIEPAQPTQSYLTSDVDCAIHDALHRSRRFDSETPAHEKERSHNIEMYANCESHRTDRGKEESNRTEKQLHNGSHQTERQAQNGTYHAETQQQNRYHQSETQVDPPIAKVEIEVVQPKQMIFGLTDTPPIHYLLLYALQQSCLALSTPLGTAAIIAKAVCADDEQSLKVKILSSTMLMMGLSTFTVTTFGIRLPIFQGPAVSYIIPLIIMMSLDEFKCPETFTVTDLETNKTTLMAVIGNNTVVRNEEVAIGRINAYAGSLMIAGAVHCLIGLTGFVSIIGRFVGPVTIIPAVTLFGIYIHTVVVSFAETNWIVSSITAVLCIVLSLYLNNYNTLIPFWTPSKGFHVIRQPIHQTFSLLISVIVGWIVSFIMTEFNALSNDPQSKEFNARTDARLSAIADTNWLIYPYPGQFGAPSFSSAALVSFMVSTILSVLDSIGDYNACARIAGAPPPPNYALNRGIAVEGLMSFLSGTLGCGHSTVSYGENIGAMSVCRVSSRIVFQVVGIIYIVCAFLGKLGAFFSIVPYSVIGGCQIVTFGILIGIILSYMQAIDLKSSRNVSIIGISLLLGMMLPYWCTKNSQSIKTGSADLDNIIVLTLSNPSFIGGLFACIMDNTISGTLAERGIGANGDLDDGSGDKDENFVYEYGPDVYRLPYIPDRFRRSRLARWIPLFDTLGNSYNLSKE